MIIKTILLGCFIITQNTIKQRGSSPLWTLLYLPLRIFDVTMHTLNMFFYMISPGEAPLTMVAAETIEFIMDTLDMDTKCLLFLKLFLTL